MRLAERQAEVEGIDRFLTDRIVLFGPEPEFGRLVPGRDGGGRERRASWPLADSLGALTGGELRVVARYASHLGHSMVLVFRERCVTRVDFVSDQECHSNPSDARLMGLPPRVCGPHFHGWEANRDHLLKQDNWNLPYREPLPVSVRRFGQALAWMADRVGIVLEPDHRGFCPPPELV